MNIILTAAPPIIHSPQALDSLVLEEFSRPRKIFFTQSHTMSSTTMTVGSATFGCSISPLRKLRKLWEYPVNYVMMTHEKIYLFAFSHSLIPTFCSYRIYYARLLCFGRKSKSSLLPLLHFIHKHEMLCFFLCFMLLFHSITIFREVSSLYHPSRRFSVSSKSNFSPPSAAPKLWLCSLCRLTWRFYRSIVK